MSTPQNATPDPRRPVKFFSIEEERPARAFWQSLARLLFTLGAAARRRGETHR